MLHLNDPAAKTSPFRQFLESLGIRVVIFSKLSLHYLRYRNDRGEDVYLADMLVNYASLEEIATA